MLGGGVCLLRDIRLKTSIWPWLSWNSGCSSSVQNASGTSQNSGLWNCVLRTSREMLASPMVMSMCRLAHRSTVSLDSAHMSIADSSLSVVYCVVMPRCLQSIGRPGHPVDRMSACVVYMFSARRTARIVNRVADVTNMYLACFVCTFESL